MMRTTYDRMREKSRMKTKKMKKWRTWRRIWNRRMKMTSWDPHSPCLPHSQHTPTRAHAHARMHEYHLSDPTSIASRGCDAEEWIAEPPDPTGDDLIESSTKVSAQNLKAITRKQQSAVATPIPASRGCEARTQTPTQPPTTSKADVQNR